MKVLWPLLLLATPVAAEGPDCGGTPSFDCMKGYAAAQIDRLGLTPSADHQASLEAIGALQSYYDGGPRAAVEAFEARGLAVYDLVFALTAARHFEDVRIALAAAAEPPVTDAKGEALTGDEAVAMLKRDVFDWHGAGEDGVYTILCKGDADAFAALMGSVPQENACADPYQTLDVRRVFGALQIRRGMSSADAFRAAMEYAFREQACEIGVAVLEASYHWKAVAEDEDTAVWRIIDVATLCASELIEGVRL